MCEEKKEVIQKLLEENEFNYYEYKEDSDIFVDTTPSLYSTQPHIKELIGITTLLLAKGLKFETDKFNNISVL
jgi:hypothetical protein